MILQDDFDIGAEEEANLEVKDRPEVQEKLERRIRSVEVKIITPPRPGAHVARGLDLRTISLSVSQSVNQSVNQSISQSGSVPMT